MKALTLWRPWPWAIFFGGKCVENRDWKPPASLIGERIAIHAGKRRDSGDADAFIVERAGRPLPPEALHEGVIGTARLVGVVDELGLIMGTGGGIAPAQTARWFVGEFGWLLDERVALSTPIPCSGAQGLWTVPPDIEARLSGADLGERP